MTKMLDENFQFIHKQLTIHFVCMTIHTQKELIKFEYCVFCLSIS